MPNPPARRDAVASAAKAVRRTMKIGAKKAGAAAVECGVRPAIGDVTGAAGAVFKSVDAISGRAADAAHRVGAIRAQTLGETVEDILEETAGARGVGQEIAVAGIDVAAISDGGSTIRRRCADGRSGRARRPTATPGRCSATTPSARVERADGTA